MSSIPRGRRDMAALAVLALLWERPSHPYEMLRKIRDRRKDFVTGLPRSLYHAVDKLLTTELIEPVETSREGRRPERTVYQITAEGTTELFSWMRDLIMLPGQVTPPFAAAISLWAIMPPSQVLDLLKVRLARLEGEIATLDAQRRALESILPRIVVVEDEYTRALRAAERDWVESVMRDITEGRLTWDPDELRRVAAEWDGQTEAPGQADG